MQRAQPDTRYHRRQVSVGRSRARIQLTAARAQADCPGPLRRVVVWDAENEREVVLLTNLFEFGATTIAEYKERGG